MNSLLDVRVDRDHPMVKVRVLPHQDLGVPRHRDENCVDTAGKWGRENIANLQSDQERESDHHRSVGSVRVVGWRREDKVEVREKRTGVGDECGAHRQNWSDQALVDQCVDTAIFDHPADAQLVISRYQMWERRA
jgi:hypothetical protein